MPQDVIRIFTTHNPYQDLLGLIGRIETGDTPGTKELLAILRNILGNMPGEE